MPPTPPSFAQYAPASGQMPPQEPQPFQSQNPYAAVQPPQPSQYPHAVVHGYPGGMYSPPPQLDWFQAQHAAGQLYVDGWGQQSGASMGACGPPSANTFDYRTFDERRNSPPSGASESTRHQPDAPPPAAPDAAAIAVAVAMALRSAREAESESREAKRPSIYEVRDLSTKEVEAYSTTLARAEIPQWSKRFRFLLQSKHPVLARVLSFDDIDVLGAETARSSELAHADGYLSRMIDCCLDSKSDKVRTLKTLMAEDELLLRCGLYKLMQIEKMYELASGPLMRIEERDFKTKVYFKAGMRHEESQYAAQRLIADFESLDLYRVPIDTWRALIRKLPDSLDKKRQDMWDKLVESKCGGQKP